jgi:lysophospholipase L1-like esterase
MKRLLIILGCVALVAVSSVYIRQVIHETVQSAKPGQQYVVALGDSVAAGAGLSTDGGRGAAGCDVADTAFPYLVGKQLSLPVEQFACSGATVAATTTNTTNILLGTQYNMAKPFLAGSNVIVNAGANDIGWLQLLTSCAQTNCATAQTSAAITVKVAQLQTSLTILLIQLQQARPHRLVVNTYYSLVAPGDTCVARFGITPEEVSFINDEEAELNAAITAAAKHAKATIVNVDFDGHLLCDQTPWIQSISDKAPLHPTAAGQQQIATQDAKALPL